MGRSPDSIENSIESSIEDSIERRLLHQCLLWDSPEKAWYRRVPP